MARTHKKVRYSPDRKDRGHTPASAAEGVEQALKVLEGRWKLVILFHLFDGRLVRFSELERAIPAISQKMLIQQLRQLERDGVVRRIVHHQVPPKVEYGLTDWGEALCRRSTNCSSGLRRARTSRVLQALKPEVSAFDNFLDRPRTPDCGHRSLNLE
jgi:DNA-binding HxlR family transcriptional regulator